ncbi:fasciclin domain-containing protein [Rubripirellula reticaptiva]|uniref:Immunogenic protein MPT70 n=1 Tax=Rubripirellula reticaptiva TaxID=2528013 RepID=A0A5C6EEF0_9BACT|nr:fasciclin domain-containing protein [Rubripirellula reticaptiva]TWU46834.1 Immunogenic protein MPT70 precursor [Rubripirellula reticaptiva]
MNRFTFLTCFAVLAFAGMPFVNADQHDEKTKDIVDTAVAAKFNTLVAAVKAGDLVETLKSKGPFTVLAPTDEAFAALPEGTLESLLKPENKSKLQAILKYHVIPGKVVAKQVMTISEAKTVEGSMVKVKTEGGTVMINSAKVVKADVMCSNGVIHVIDKVLLPTN